MSSQADARPGQDAAAGRVTADLVRQYHLMPPDAVSATLAEAARPLGVTGAQVYLADLQQRQLVPVVAEGQAELVWAFLPPRTLATSRVLVCASLEPAYEVGGDAFDYSLLGDHLHVSIFDALGHDLAAGLLASVGLASCRSTRRAGGSLADIAARADHAIAAQFGDHRFVTALLCDLDLATGLLSWIPCGHPPPLLIRGNRTVRELARQSRLPLGLGDEDPAVLCTEKLEPGDRVLLYTDGVTEGRAADGIPFGARRLADFIIRHSAAGLPAPEMMRRLKRAILEYQHGRLRDDATTVLVEWQPSRPGPSLTP